MPGLSDGENFTIVALFVLGIGYMIYKMDRRVKADGTLVKRDGSSKSRMYALLMGLLVASFVALGWIVGSRNYSLLILSLALLGSLVRTVFIRSFQEFHGQYSSSIIIHRIFYDFRLI